MGRFLEPDPIGFLGGVNFYAYVGNNSVNFVDPWGWCKKYPFPKKWNELTAEDVEKYGNSKPVPLSEDPVFLGLLIGQNIGKGGLYRPDGPGHGLGPHDHIGPWRTGPKVPNWGREVWKGWIDWIKQGGGWKWPWN